MTLWAITGGSGYIAIALTRRLLEKGDRVRLLVREGSPQVPDVEIVCGDVRNEDVVRQLVAGTDVTVHLAAYVHKRAISAHQRKECWGVNVEGTRCVVRVLAAAAPGSFLIYVSSASVYPAQSTAASESSPTAPSGYYGAAKLAAEDIVREAIRHGQIRGAILRPAMVVGPGAPGNQSRLVRLVRSRAVVLLGDGTNAKSLAPIELVIGAIQSVAADSQITNGRTYNVSGGALTMRAIVSLIADELHVRPLVLRLPAAPFRAAAVVFDALSRWSHLPSLAQMVATAQSNSLISADALRCLPSFSFDVPLEESLRTAVRPASPLRASLASRQTTAT